MFSMQDDKQLVCEKLDTFKNEFKTKEKTVTIAYVKPGVIFNSTKELILTFDSPTEVTNFKEAFTKVLQCLR